jgi:glucuronate isomerase
LTLHIIPVTFVSVAESINHFYQKEDIQKMKKTHFIHENFLLETKHAKKLYHEYAESLPIVDFHTHLSARLIADDAHFRNITHLWLGEDHYKWRLMRANGIPELYCTGNAPDREKFQKWAETLPLLADNPLYHWSHMELKRVFGISDKLLSPETAESIWKECNKKLSLPEYTCRGIMKKFNLRILCTTDDPADSLEEHKKIARDSSFNIKVLPAWRPDNAIMVENPSNFKRWIKKLEAVSNSTITNFATYQETLRKRHDYFHNMGCRLSDYGLETVYNENYTESQLRRIFNKLINGKILTETEILQWKSAMLYEFAKMDYEKNWVQQYHLGALRNNNTKMYKMLGPNTGFDSVGDFSIARPLAKLLDRLNSAGYLPKTILYNMNPADNAVIATMTGNFQDGSIPGKLQFGSAWWFLDQKKGMEEQLETLTMMGVIGRFVGMVTDSRSFLSFVRHEYFRRILCNWLGNKMAKGLIPDDFEMAGNIIRNICYLNAVHYFGFEKFM